MKVSQSDFRAALLDPKAQRPSGLSDGKGDNAGRRFDVYRNNVAVSLTEALETAFPVVAKLVGTQNFKTLAGAFLRAHPPASPLMMFYGSELPAFIAAFPPTREIGYLPDVARLELALRQSYHAADAQPINPAVLETTPTETLMASRVGLAPSLRLIRSPWPIHAIWRFNIVEGAAKPEMAAEDIAVLRMEFDPEPVLLGPGMADFVETLTNGRALGEAVESASLSPDFDLGRTLALLLAHECIISIGEMT